MSLVQTVAVGLTARGLARSIRFLVIQAMTCSFPVGPVAGLDAIPLCHKADLTSRSLGDTADDLAVKLCFLPLSSCCLKDPPVHSCS